MTDARRRRWTTIALVLSGVGIASALTLSALKDNLLFFYTPSQLRQLPQSEAGIVRLGGLVEGGSVVRDPTTLQVRFVVADEGHRIAVEYQGLLPDLFREERGVVASGRLSPDGVFRAHEVLAKHEETYAPPADAAGQAAKRPAWVHQP